jgi:ketosteroid isomerase-like protein
VSELEELTSRLQRFEDERSILATMHRYGPALDYGDEQGWASLFTEDGVFAIEGRHPNPRRIEGRDALVAFATQHSRAPDRIHKHCVFDSQVIIDGDNATAVSYFTRLDLTDEGPVIHAFGRYIDDLHRASDGWRFRERRASIEAIRA